MRAAAGFLVIFGVILGAGLSLGIAGVAGAGLVQAIGSIRGANHNVGRSWPWIAGAIGLAAGGLAAFVVGTVATVADVSLGRIALAPTCWSAAGLAGAATQAIRRHRQTPPAGG